MNVSLLTGAYESFTKKVIDGTLKKDFDKWRMGNFSETEYRQA